MHQNQSLPQSRSCLNVGSWGPGCRRGRSRLWAAQRSPQMCWSSPGPCWWGERRVCMSWDIPVQMRQLPHPSVDTLPSLLGHHCCCHGEDNLTRGEEGQQTHSSGVSALHLLCVCKEKNESDRTHACISCSIIKIILTFSASKYKWYNLITNQWVWYNK